MKRVAGILGAILAVTALLLFASGTALAPPSASADMSTVGGVSGDLYPIANNDVRMEAETVQAVCYRCYAEFRVDFKFVNAGSAQTLQLGFPYMVKPPSATPPLVGFRAWQDGTPLAVALGDVASSSTTAATGPVAPVEGYFLMNARFPPGQTMISVTYLAEPSWWGQYRLPSTTPADLKALGLEGQVAKYDYWLHTGATWAGTIGRATVVFRLADDFDGWAVDVKACDPAVKGSKILVPTTKPETYTRPDPRTYRWAFEDLEPTEADDIVLAFSGGAFGWLQSEGPDHQGEVPADYGAVPIPITASDNLDYHYDGLASARDGWWAVEGSLARSWSMPAPGKGSWIKIGVEGNRDLKEIRVIPGRNDAFDSFGKYGRPKDVRVTLSDGTSATISLKDEPSIQKFPISGTAEWVRLEVLSIYPGTKNNDTYITEIGFGNEPAPSFLAFSDLISETDSGRTGAISTVGASASGGTGATAKSVGAAPAESSARFPGRIVWPVFGVLAGTGLVLALAWVARRRLRLMRVRRRSPWSDE